MLIIYADATPLAKIIEDTDYDPPKYIGYSCSGCGAHVRPGMTECEYCKRKRKIKDSLKEELNLW